MATYTNPQVAVVMVPLPAQGHLNQLLHLSRIISAADIPVYYVGGGAHIHQAKLRVHGWDPSAVKFQEFSIPPFENPPANPDAPNKFPLQLLPSFSASTHLREPLLTFLSEQATKFRRVVIIFDVLMAYVVQDIDSIPNAEAYCFRCSSAFTVHAFHWDAAGRPEVAAVMMKEIPPLNGLIPPEFSEFSKLQRGCRKVFCADIYNSSREIEGVYIDLMEKSQTTGAGKVWAIGPLNPISLHSKKDSRIRHRSLKWLDEQESDSVIFVSFGTTTSLQNEQIQEVAYGLERSERKFIWVVREADKGDIFADEVRTSELQLPEGFEERVRERGIVVRDWAPQLEILGHPSTGGFMSHCGWNSCMESISHGVPMATWPMHSDQPTNAFLVTEVLRVGVKVVEWVYRNELVTAERVEDALRKLMSSEEGDEMRRRAKELGSSLDKGTITTNTDLDSFITHLTR